jgi:hypothetical protein
MRYERCAFSGQTTGRAGIESESRYDQPSVGQCVLVSSPIRCTRPDINYRLTVSVFVDVGRPSDERSGLSFVIVIIESQSHITTDDQSVSASWFRAPSGDHDQMLITVWLFLFLSMSGAPSDERSGLSFVLVT